MNCTNSECMKVIRKSYHCNKCGNIFCSNSCLTEHTLDTHSSNKIIESDNSRISYLQSPFIKTGQLLKDNLYDSYYDFHNFIAIKNKDGKSNKLVGSGAIGNVYLAKNKIDDKLYAIKHMKKKKLVKSGATIDIIHREISIHERIRHENIIRLYSHYEDDKNIYLIMEYANSGTLFNIINNNKGCDLKTAFHYFIQVASAVSFLHENNLIHRDLKPENLLLDENDNIKLCDFGWCVDTSKGSRITFCGTYEYMAPEIIQEMPYDKSIDVWSLGILLYELIHGYSPFRAQNEQCEEEYEEIFKNIIKYNFKIEKNIDNYCKDLITKLLNPNNKTRMKIGQIFNHPWVLSFEKEYKQKTFNKIIPDEEELAVDEKNINKNKFEIIDNQLNLDMDTIGDQEKNNIKLDESGIEIKKRFLEKIKIFDRKREENIPNRKEKEKVSSPRDRDESKIIYKKEDDIEEKLNTEDSNLNTKTNSSGARKNTQSSTNSNNKNEDDENILSKSDFNYYKNKEHEYLKAAYNYIDTEKQIKIPFDTYNQNQRDKLFDQVINKLEKKNSHKKRKQNNKNIHSYTVTNKFNPSIQNEKISHSNKRNRTMTLSEIQNDLNHLKNINDTFIDLKIDEEPKILESNTDSSNLLDNIMLINYNDNRCNKNEILFDKTDDNDKIRYTRNIYSANYPQNTNFGRKRNNNSIDISNYITRKKNDKRHNEINKEIDFSFLCGEYKEKDTSSIAENPRNNLMQAIHSLENPEKEQDKVNKEVDRNNSFWEKVSSFFNPFRCGKDA